MLLTDNPKSATKRSRKMGREPKSDATEQKLLSKHQSKAAEVLAMLERQEGATLDQLVAATGWLPHTTRAALTGLKKKGHVVTSNKTICGVRTYRFAPAAEASQ